ncbi:unnamed protein product [Chondrus crispus]|uniref:Uncharacterized protein n=1 Tax=Chondrus crispus TaxID=2769 RepID=R7QAJ6_CHOCR|nr:unnamed protein product [Chondrus crispus]CDF34446.1 unnamed protein product [Chondrus crispus]|eukprot:XP_005714265.1 unnamed protein product [Chondrus crispus]
MTYSIGLQHCVLQYLTLIRFRCLAQYSTKGKLYSATVRTGAAAATTSFSPYINSQEPITIILLCCEMYMLHRPLHQMSNGDIPLEAFVIRRSAKLRGMSLHVA